MSFDPALTHSNLYNDFKDYLKYGAYPFFMEDKDEFKNRLFNALQNYSLTTPIFFDCKIKY